MYLIFLVKDGKEEVYSILGMNPSKEGLREEAQAIANHQGFPVVLRSHYSVSHINPHVGFEMRVEPQGQQPAAEPTDLEKLISVGQ